HAPLTGRLPWRCPAPRRRHPVAVRGAGREGQVRRILAAICAVVCLAGLGACAGAPVVQPGQHDDTSRATCLRALTSVTGLHQPSGPDWRRADAAALRRCRGWGHGDQRLTGWREACRGWDRWGRCTSTRVTRYYDCEG